MPEKRIDKTSLRNSQPQLQRFGLFNMPHRAASPAASENEFDITSSLFKDDVDAEDDDSGFPTSKDLGNLDTGGILDLANESDGDGDAAFIAAQQAASNRKSSHVKGKSVKKGGGFQAMGIDAPNPYTKKRLIVVKD
jgi:ATP-dependent RNA helicase DDX54/DBP10